MLQPTRIERATHRQKRVISSLVGHIAHMLFGMLDSDCEAFYNEKNAQLEEEEQLG